ncbi:MAG: VIT domain-containing protein [Chloroflexota bacterium]|nr:VIT domain-containing protein [Chloroflexota bacterium]
MKRLLRSLLLVAVLTGVLADAALADGIIIIDPPPEPPLDWQPWLTIRYHHVQVTIKDQVATTRVDQVFLNEGRWDAEGQYIFPLPPGAVVDKFTMWVDGRPQEGKILEADKARAIYEDYVRRQQDPALLEYIGRDAVQARIFPIPPGEERRIELEYSQLLPVEEGLMHYHYPLNTERFSARPLEQVSIHVEVESKNPLRALYSSTHQDEVVINREGSYRATLSYEASNIFPERDFELYASFSSAEIGGNLLSYQQGSEDGFFLLMISPNLALDSSQIIPKDILLVLDTSGSMEGEKLSQAKEALSYVLRHLNPEDRFNVISFSSIVYPYADKLRPRGESAKATEWVSKLAALGGTNIYLALSEALRQVDPERTTVLIFLTDGLPTEGITTEETLLTTLKQEAPDSVRIFPFGVGYDVNTRLLDQLAEEHKGRPAYVKPDERIDEKVSKFYARVQSPLLTDIALDFGDVQTYDLYPQPLPDIYAGTQLLLTGRYTGHGPQAITLTGNVSGEVKRYHYEGNFATQDGPDFIPRLWAARKIGYLLTQIRLHGENQEWIDSVVTLSLRYGIITPYTSFLVEDEDVLHSEQREKASETFKARPTPAAYGEEAVEDAAQRLGLGGAEAPPAAWEQEQPAASNGTVSTRQVIRYVGERTFLCTDESCTDTTFIPDKMTALKFQFGSESYWQLVSDEPLWAKYLALAPEVIFVSAEGTAYHILPGEDFVEAELPASPDEKATATPTAKPAVISTSAPEDLHRETSPRAGLCGGSLALMVLVWLCSWGLMRR